MSGTRSVDLSGLDEGRAAFARHAAAGLPSNQVFTAAKQKINGVISRVSEQLGAAWAQWTSEQLAGLPLIRIPLLGADEQKSARDRRDELLKLSKIAVPTERGYRHVPVGGRTPAGDAQRGFPIRRRKSWPCSSASASGRR